MEILPSIIAADWTRIYEEIKSVEECNLNYLHLDIMDGHFVDNLTFGMFIVDAIRKITNLKLDSHLMVKNPKKFIDKFYKSSDIVDVHFEVGEETFECIEFAKKNNFKIGIVINPKTHPKYILPFVEDVEQVIVMTVNPGFAGQEMIKEVLWKVDYLINFRIKSNLNFKITIDGGVNWENINELKKMGVDRVVMGKSFFSLDYEKRKIYALKFQKPQ
ncbi:MAG: ribulose-phosphate 3-epimerase [candidate division WOR-3 bacterium]